MMKTEDIVSWILTEESDGESGWWWGEDSGGYGGSGGATLYSTFIRPIVDVVDTAAATIETGLSKVQLLTNVVTYGVMSMIVPWVKPQYDQMIEHDRRRMAEMYRRHADTFARTEQALTEVGGNFDGAGVFFALFPGAVIARNVTKVASAGSERATKIAVDAILDFIDATTLNALGGITDVVRSKLGLHEGVVRSLLEDDERDIDVSIIARFMSAKKVRRALDESKALTALRQDALKALQGTVKLATTPIEKLTAVSNVAELQQLTGKRWQPDMIVRKLNVDVDGRDIDRVVADAVPDLAAKAAQPFVRRLQRLQNDIKALMKMYDISTSDPTAQAALKVLEAGISDIT